jgi:uncharacterized SAM-binding protein YcdF (DUF218 family)
MMKPLKAIIILSLTLVIAWCMSFILFYNEIEWNGITEPQAATDGIVVLTGGAGRIEEALSLMEAHQAKRLLISGVHQDVAATTLQGLTGRGKELFDCCIDIDHNALDTVGNAKESAKWSKLNQIKSLTIVTAHYHMPRALVEFQRHHKDIILVPHPVVSDVSLRYLITEHIKYLFAIFVR